MNAQPNPFGAGGFGTPPAINGMSRVMSHVKTLAAGGALATLLFLAWQKGAPEGWRPSDIAGDAAGSAERHEIVEKQPAKLDYERRLADATAQANAKAQTDVAAIQKVLEERTQSLQPVSTMAGTADVACLLSQITAGFTAPDDHVHGDWRHPDPDPSADLHNAAVGVARATCGMGDQLRAQVSRSQLDAIRTAAAARGAPMTNGAVQEVVAPPPLWPGAPRTLNAVYALNQASRHYDYRDVQTVQKWVAGLSPNVQQRLYANLPSNNAGWDVFVDRARAFDALTRPD